MIITHLYKFLCADGLPGHYRHLLCGKNVHHPESVTHYIQFALRKRESPRLLVESSRCGVGSSAIFFIFGFEKRYIILNSVSDLIYTNGFNRLLFQNKRCGWTPWTISTISSIPKTSSILD